MSDFLIGLSQEGKTIDEKINDFTANTVEKNNFEEQITDYLSTKNLFNKEVLHDYLKSNKYTQQQFCNGIDPNNINTSELAGWAIKFENIINKYCQSEHDIQTQTILQSIHPFVMYVSEKVSSIVTDSGISIDQNALENITQKYIHEILNLVEKVLIVELHTYKEQTGFNTRDSRTQFIEFIDAEFSTPNKIKKFYRRYPALSRLIMTRTDFHLSAVQKLFTALKKEKNNINKIVDTVSTVTKINLGVGDGHVGGQSVAIIYFGEKKLIYKPRDDYIAEQFGLFLNWINEQNEFLSMVSPNGIYRDNYAFIEFVEAKSCKTKKDISNFYERYGYLIALGYLLSMNDLHLENVIAYGEFPVLVDVETMMVPEIQESSKTPSIIEQFNQKYVKETILSSILLPNIAKLAGGVELSGLSGDEQIIPEKQLIPVNVKGHVKMS
ncbi:MAG: DUF4135 domain-containing protein [Lactobacillaceae bacterium]|nr:DUF4135 domain-containing protein [Lactobacillaceae bacterium]